MAHVICKQIITRTRKAMFVCLFKKLFIAKVGMLSAELQFAYAN